MLPVVGADRAAAPAGAAEAQGRTAPGVGAGGARKMGISAWYALSTPLGAGVFAAMMFTSTWKALSGQGIRWKGRGYDPKTVR